MHSLKTKSVYVGQMESLCTKNIDKKEESNIIDLLAERIAEILIAKNDEQTPHQESPTNTHFYTVAEVCQMLRISKATFYRHKNLGLITPAQCVGVKPLFTEESIKNYLHNFKN